MDVCYGVMKKGTPVEGEEVEEERACFEWVRGVLRGYVVC